jgi:hypothetical protein
MSNSDDWKITEVTADDETIRFFMKNMVPSESPANPAYPFLAYVTFRYRDLDERGLPRGDDWVAVQEIENSAANALEVDRVAVHVAEVLGHGVKDLVFYIRDVGAFANRASHLLRKYAHLAPSVEITLDPEWSQYADFP